MDFQLYVFLRESRCKMSSILCGMFLQRFSCQYFRQDAGYSFT